MSPYRAFRHPWATIKCEIVARERGGAAVWRAFRTSGLSELAAWGDRSRTYWSKSSVAWRKSSSMASLSLC